MGGSHHAPRRRSRQNSRRRVRPRIRGRPQNCIRNRRAPEADPRRSLSRISQNPMKYYLTTPIYYVNAAPHIGHAYTTLAADTIKRLKTMQGYEAVLTTGTDEHGQKVERSAQAMGKSPAEFATIISNEF